MKAWLKRHPRFVLHFVPTSSSWLNLVERWFHELTYKAIGGECSKNVPDLKAWNEEPKPFVWTATVESIMEKITKRRQTLETIAPGSTLPRSSLRTQRELLRTQKRA